MAKKRVGDRKKKKQQQPQAKKKGSRRGGMGGQGYMGLTMQVCSITNPFCPEAKGARWPDDSYQRSVGYPQQGSTPLTTNATGQIGALYGPVLNAGLANATAWVGNDATMGNFGLLTSSATVSGVVRYRLTSYGLKISCYANPMTIAGRLRIRLFSPMTTASLATLNISTLYADNILDIPLARLIDKDLFVVAAPLGTQARMFVNTTDTAIATQPNPGWQYISVGVDSAPATTPVLNVEYFYNWELCFDDNSALQQFATAPPKVSVLATQTTGSVIGSIGNFIEGTAAKVDAIFNSKAAKYLGAAIGGYYGGPQGASMGYTALTNYSHNARSVD